MNSAVEKSMQGDEASLYAKIRLNSKQLINVACLDSVVDAMSCILQNHEQTLSRHASELKMIGLLESKSAALSSRIVDLERLLRRKDEEIMRIFDQLELFQKNEAIIRARLDRVEHDFIHFRANRDSRDHEVGELKVQMRIVSDKADDTETKANKALSELNDLKTTQHWLHDGQLAGRVVKLEKDLGLKADISKVYSELEMRDKLRKENVEITENSLRRIERYEKLVENLSNELLSKANTSDLRSIETRISGKAEKEDLNEMRRVVRILEDDHKKKSASLEENKAEAVMVKQIDSRLATAEVEVKTVKDGFRLAQDYMSKITSSLSSFASDIKLQALTKVVQEIEQRDSKAELLEIHKRIDDKAEKESVKVLQEMLHTILYEEGNGTVATRVHYRCLTCNRFAPGSGSRDGFTARSEEILPSTPMSPSESGVFSKQMSIVGNDGRIYRGRDDPQEPDPAPYSHHTAPCTIHSRSQPNLGGSASSIPPITHARPVSPFNTRPRPASGHFSKQPKS